MGRIRIVGADREIKVTWAGIPSRGVEQQLTEEISDLNETVSGISHCSMTGERE